ncbi:MAG: hypothetical protein ACLP0L_17980 [Solirubrobacteraceae bacterium]
MTVRPQRGAVSNRLVPAALVPAGAFAVHQLRYWLAYGHRAGFELAVQGHSYLPSVVPWIVMLIAFAVGTFLVAFGRALDAVAGRCARRVIRADRARVVARTRLEVLLPALAPLVDGWSGRGPSRLISPRRVYGAVLITSRGGQP